MVRPFRELDFFEDRFAAVAEILRRHAAEPARVCKGLQGRQVAVEFRGLDDRTDPSECTCRFPPHIDAEQGGPTARWSDQVGHDLDGCRLARSIRPEEAKGGALRNRQVEGLEGGEVTVFLAEALEVDGGIACDWLFDDGFHEIAIYRDILKSLVKIPARIGPHAFRARPVRRVAGALKPREKVSHLWSRSSRR